MRSPSESIATAKSETKDFIHNQESAARSEQGKMPDSVSGLNAKSLTSIGNAIHTATDGTSPAHVDSNGNPKVWTGLEHPIDTLHHIEAESTISDKQMNNAVDAAHAAFKATYGDKLYNQAVTPSGQWK